MKKIGLFFLLCSFWLPMRAQQPAEKQLLANPDILWVGRSVELIILDTNAQELSDFYLQTVGLWEQKWLQCEPLQPARGQNLACELMGKSTQTAACETVKSFQIEQLFYFDQRANNFGSLLLSISPVLALADSSQTSPVKVANLHQPAQLSPQRRGWQTQRHYFVERLQTIKASKSLFECFALQLEAIREYPEREQLRNWQDTAQHLSQTEIAQMGVRVDTMPSYDPETFDEITIIETIYTSEKNLDALRFIQRWYWDESSRTIQLHNLFFAPVVNHYSEYGMFLIALPMFYKPSH